MKQINHDTDFESKRNYFRKLRRVPLEHQQDFLDYLKTQSYIKILFNSSPKKERIDDNRNDMKFNDVIDDLKKQFKTSSNLYNVSNPNQRTPNNNLSLNSYDGKESFTSLEEETTYKDNCINLFHRYLYEFLIHNDETTPNDDVPPIFFEFFEYYYYHFILRKLKQPKPLKNPIEPGKVLSFDSGYETSLNDLNELLEKNDTEKTQYLKEQKQYEKIFPIFKDVTFPEDDYILQYNTTGLEQVYTTLSTNINSIETEENYKVFDPSFYIKKDIKRLKNNIYNILKEKDPYIKEDSINVFVSNIGIIKRSIPLSTVDTTLNMIKFYRIIPNDDNFTHASGKIEINETKFNINIDPTNSPLFTGRVFFNNILENIYLCYLKKFENFPEEIEKYIPDSTFLYFYYLGNQTTKSDDDLQKQAMKKERNTIIRDALGNRAFNKYFSSEESMSSSSKKNQSQGNKNESKTDPKRRFDDFTEIYLDDGNNADYEETLFKRCRFFIRTLENKTLLGNNEIEAGKRIFQETFKNNLKTVVEYLITHSFNLSLFETFLYANDNFGNIISDQYSLKDCHKMTAFPLYDKVTFEHFKFYNCYRIHEGIFTGYLKNIENDTFSGFGLITDNLLVSQNFRYLGYFLDKCVIEKSENTNKPTNEIMNDKLFYYNFGFFKLTIKDEKILSLVPNEENKIFFSTYNLLDSSLSKPICYREEDDEIDNNFVISKKKKLLLSSENYVIKDTPQSTITYNETLNEIISRLRTLKQLRQKKQIAKEMADVNKALTESDYYKNLSPEQYKPKSHFPIKKIIQFQNYPS
jgi:hypothetical protein